MRVGLLAGGTLAAGALALLPVAGATPPAAAMPAPLAAHIAVPDTTIECMFPAMLVGSMSTGAIVAWEWFEDYGRGTERLFGTGPIVNLVAPVGSHVITLRVTDAQGHTATDEVELTAADTAPPSIDVEVTPSLLWPPNHRLVEVRATVSAGDACGMVWIALRSIDSDEPDDAPGPGDGATRDDIQGVSGGAEDYDFRLRAERAAGGRGRTYAVTYSARDERGNMETDTVEVIVPPELHGVAEPMMLAVYESGAGTVAAWTPHPGALRYDVVRGRLRDLRVDPDRRIDLGRPVCVARDLSRADTEEFADPAIPPPGEAFFYLVQYHDARGASGYGTESAGRERVASPGADGCQVGD